MPLRLVRSDSNARLWEACADAFLDELGGARGPVGFPSHLWLSHRTQRDLLLETAGGRGLPGWLAPPFSFLSEFPRRFEIGLRPIGPLTGRLLIGRLAARAARTHGFGDVAGADPGRGHMIDRAFSELLPEGVAAEELARALATLPRDEFTVRRDAWLLDTYERYTTTVRGRGQFDPRSIHALVADRIRAGALPAAVGGATRLHVFGVTSLRGRRGLFEALAEQSAVDVVAYVPGGPDDEWDALAPATDTPRSRAAGEPPRPAVQPAPDAIREARWVARRVKERIALDGVAPHRIAVIARSGREDTRRLHDELERAGVPATSRRRSRLHEVPALRALLQLFDAVADGWAWTSLRAVVGSPYFDVRLDVRGLDVLASRARPRGVPEWAEGLRRLAEETRSERGWVLERAGLSAARLERDVARLERFHASIAPLEGDRPEAGWIEATRELLRGRPLDLQRAVCEPVGERWDVVRLDQRGVLAVDGLLREWSDLLPLAAVADGGLTAAAWRARLGRLLEANEIAISSPRQRGVQVLEAHEAGATPFEHAFVVHANDGVFPQPIPGGLFTDAERERLVAAGVPLATRALTLERERRLWRASTGSVRVDITYRTADAGGVPRLASLFVPDHDRARELPRTRHELPPQEGEVERPVTEADVLEHEMLRFRRVRRSGRRDAFSTPYPDEVRHAALSAFGEELRSGGLDEHARQHARPRIEGGAGLAPDSEAAAALFGNERPLSERPGPWNGELRDPAVLELLARRFPEGREWSASQLETYARRPFDFLLQRVLGLDRIDTAEDEADRLTVGALVHAVLEAFYRERLDRPAAEFDEETRRSLAGAFEDVCRRYEEDERAWVGLPHVWAATRAELEDRLEAFVRWELEAPRRAIPHRVELAFGRGTAHPAVDLSGPGLDRRPHRLLLAGRVDRVDRLEAAGPPRLRVIDYKSGGASSAPSPRAFQDGAALQAALYMAAVEALGLGRAESGSYRTVRDPGDRARRGPADVEPALRIARDIPARVRRGLFEGVQAGSTSIRDWQPGPDLVRSAARLSSGTRFDAVAPLSIPRAVDAEAAE